MAYGLVFARTLSAPPTRVFELVLTCDLTEVFDRRFMVLAPVVAVDADPAWGEVGSARRITVSDGSTFVETLTHVTSGREISYRMTDITGPLKLLVHEADGRWLFDSHDTGCRVAWSWTVDPPNRVAEALESFFRPQWSRYAGRAMSRLERRLRRSHPS